MSECYTQKYGNLIVPGVIFMYVTKERDGVGRATH